jgi:MFS family permease
MMGWGLATAVSILYFTRHVGLSAYQVAAGLTISAVAGMVLAVPAGRVADRRSHRVFLMGGTLVQALGAGVYAFAGNFPLYVLAAVALATGNIAANAGRNTLIGRTFAGPDGTVVRAHLRSSSNLGITLGLAAAGLALHADTVFGYRIVFGTYALCLAVSALVLVGVPASGGATTAPTSPVRRRALRDGSFVNLAIVCGLLSLDYSLLEVAVPLRVTDAPGVPPTVLSWLFLTNTILVIALQVPISKRLATIRSATAGQVIAGICLGLACLLLGLSTIRGGGFALVVLAAAVIALTAAELIQSAGAWTLGFGLAPSDRHGEYGAVLSFGFSLASIIGPAIAALVNESGLVGWALAMAVFIAIGVSIVPVAGRRARVFRSEELSMKSEVTARS